MTVTLRSSDDRDTHALVRVFVAAFQRGYPGVLPADVLAGVTADTVTGWFHRWTAELITSVAETDGVVVGFVRYGADSTRPDPDIGYVAALYVDPDAAGRGIGRLLLDHAVAALAAQGRTCVTLWVFRDNARARSLYARAGFVPDGTETIDPQWRVPQVRLQLDLRGAGPAGS